MKFLERSLTNRPAVDAGTWIGRVVIAVILAEGILGIYCFRHQQPDSALAGEDYGRRRPVACCTLAKATSTSRLCLPRCWSFALLGSLP